MTVMAQRSERDAQRGLSLWGWLYVLATLGVILLAGIKSAPVYMANYEVQSVLTWAANQDDLRNAAEHEIQSRIQQRFSAGYVDSITGRDVEVKRVEGGRRLSVQYDRTEPLFGNVSLHFEFHETALLPTQSR